MSYYENKQSPTDSDGEKDILDRQDAGEGRTCTLSELTEKLITKEGNEYRLALRFLPSINTARVQNIDIYSGLRVHLHASLLRTSRVAS